MRAVVLSSGPATRRGGTGAGPGGGGKATNTLVDFVYPECLAAAAALEDDDDGGGDTGGGGGGGVGVGGGVAGGGAAVGSAAFALRHICTYRSRPLVVSTDLLFKAVFLRSCFCCAHTNFHRFIFVVTHMFIHLYITFYSATVDDAGLG
jgi:hypothetical protein